MTVQSADEGTSPRDDIIKAIYENLLKQLSNQPASNQFQRPVNQFNEPEENDDPARPANSFKQRPSYQVVPASIYKPMYTTPYAFVNNMRQSSFAGPYNPSFYSPYGSSPSFYRPVNPYPSYPFFMRQKPVYAGAYHQSMYNPFQQSMYSPYHQSMYNPYRQSMYGPYHQSMYSPYRQSVYSPYHQSMHSPYHQSMHSPYNKYQAAYYHPVTGMPYHRMPVAVLKPLNQQPYRDIALPTNQLPNDDNFSGQEAMHSLEALKTQQQNKPQPLYPSLALPYSFISRQPDSLETVNNLSRISTLYSQVADALSSASTRQGM